MTAGQLEFWPARQVAERVGGLITGPDHAELWEAFTCDAGPGVWLVAQWVLTPKQETNGWWFTHWWEGPGTRTWRGTADGYPPASAARFPTAAVAAETLALDEIAFLAGTTCWRHGRCIVTATCPCGERAALSCGEHLAVAHYRLSRACEHDPEWSQVPAGDRRACEAPYAGLASAGRAA
jgi:hypothetical protein